VTVNVRTGRKDIQHNCVCYRACAVVVCALLLVIAFGSTPAYAAYNSLTSVLRGGGTLAIGDVVTFGVLPAGTVNALGRADGNLPLENISGNFGDYMPGTPLPWRVMASGGGSAVLVLAPGYDLGYRPANGTMDHPTGGPADKFYPPFDQYEHWAGSELCAWLNSSQAASGIDYSLDAGGVDGYGFLETAFSTEQQSVLLPYGTTDWVSYLDSPVYFPINQRVVLPSMTDALAWDYFNNYAGYMPNNRNWFLRTPGRYIPYELDFHNNVYPVPQIGSTNSRLDIAVRPVIRIDLNADFFKSPMSSKTPEPIIYGQPLSATHERDALAEPLTVLAEVGDNFVSTSLSYQWYCVEGGSGNPLLAGETSKEFIPPTDTPGRFIYVCEVMANSTLGPVSVLSAPVIVSVAIPQSAGLQCRDCHTTHVRKLHKDSECTTCHTQAPRDWAGTVPEDRFINYQITCGLEESDCHGSGSANLWHGEDVFDSHRVHNKVRSGNNVSGAVQTDIEESSTFNSCGGGRFDRGCHVRDNGYSPFVFGNMNLMTAHNDYAKAQQAGSTQIQSGLEGPGCNACHTTLDTRPLAGTGITNINCSTCHNGEPYTTFGLVGCEGAKAIILLSADASSSAGSLTQQQADQQINAAPITQISQHIQQLVGGLLGITSEEQPLEAGVLELPSPDLPRGFFPLGSLLGGSNPLLP